MDNHSDNYIIKVYELICERINLLITYDLKILNLMIIIFGVGFGFGIASKGNVYQEYLLIFFPIAIYILLFYIIHVYLTVLSLCGYKKWLEEEIREKSIHQPILLMELLHEKVTFRSIALYGSYTGYSILLVLSIYKSIETATHTFYSSSGLLYIIISFHALLIIRLFFTLKKFLTVYDQAYNFAKEKFLRSHGDLKIRLDDPHKKLIVHFLYGSRPKKEFSKTQKKIFGGILGGHVYLEIAGFFYGFERINRKKLHIFPRKKYNSYFKKEVYEDWKQCVDNSKITSVEIPLDNENAVYLINLLEKYVKNVPYDYSFFGMRCGASSYQILSQIGLFPVASRFISIILVPYPRLLRRKLIHLAISQNFKMSKQKGIYQRIWEKE